MKQVIKGENKLILNVALIGLKYLLSRELPSLVRKCPGIILQPILLLSLLLSIPSISVAAPGKGVELINDLVGTFGEVTDVVKGETERLIEESGLVAAAEEAQDAMIELAEGKVPVISDLTDPLQDDVEKTMAQALSKAQIASNILKNINAVAARKTLDFIANSPLFVDADFGLTLPIGRLRIYRKGLDVSVCLTTVGAFNTVVISGISNAAQLCNSKEPRMANPTKSLLAFTDIITDTEIGIDYYKVGHQHFRTTQVLLPNITADLTELPAPIEAESYVMIHGQWVQIKLAGADPDSLEIEGKLQVGLKGGASYYVQAEIEGEAAITVKLKPTYAVEVIKGATKAMFDQATSMSLDVGSGNFPDDAAAIMQAGLEYLSESEGKYEGGFGETSIFVTLNGEIGAGAWDTGIAGVSAGGSSKLTMPLDALVSIGSGALSRYLDIAHGMNNATLDLSTSILEGDAANELENFKAEARRASSTFIEGVLNDLLAITTKIEFAADFRVTTLGDVDKESIDLYESGIYIPIGKISTNLQENPNAIGDALTASAELMLSAIDPDSVIDEQVWTDLSQVIHPDITYTLKAFDPIQVKLIGVTDAGLLDTIKVVNIMREVFYGLVLSAKEGSLKPIRTAMERSLDTADPIILNILNNLKTTSSRELSANGSLGAEVVADLGVGISLEAEVKSSLLLLILGVPQYLPPEEPKDNPLAKVAVPIKASLDIGASVGEAVELTVDGGGSLNFNLFELSAIHWDEDLPSATLMNVAGFSVLEFTNDNNESEINPDGSFSGSGYLMLPMGGIVSAEFAVDEFGNVTSGTWSGGLELGPLGDYSFLEGALDNDGLHGTVKGSLLGSKFNANFILNSSGLLLGSYDGSITIGGHELAAASLYLGADGQFTGHYDGDISIGGFAANSNFDFDNNGFTGSSYLNVLGSELTSNDIVITRSGTVSGTFTGNIVAGPHTLSAVSLRTVNGGLVGTAMMGLPGAGNVQVNLRIINGKVTATYSGEFLNGLASQASMEITGTGIMLSASLNTATLSTTATQVVGDLTTLANTAANNLIPGLSTNIDTVVGLLQTAQTNLIPANVNAEVKKLVDKAWSTGAGLLEKGVLFLAHADYVAKDAAYWTAKELYDLSCITLFNITTCDEVVLGPARDLAKSLRDIAYNVWQRLERELAAEIENLKQGLLDTRDKFLTQWLNLTRMLMLGFDPASLFSIQRVSFDADLQTLIIGSNINVSSLMTFMGQSGQINLSLNLDDPVENFFNIATDLLFVNVQLTSDTTLPSVISTTPSEWQSGSALIQLNASDNKSVASITYHIGDEGTAITVPGNQAIVLLETEGMTTLNYFATDISGNVSGTGTVTVSLDNNAPEITVEPVSKNGDIYEVAISAKDTQGSGISYLAVSANGAEVITETIEWSGTTVVSLTTPGITILTITAVDEAGNITTLTKEVTVPEEPVVTVPGEPVVTVPVEPTDGSEASTSEGAGALGLLWLLLATIMFGLRRAQLHISNHQ